MLFAEIFLFCGCSELVSTSLNCLPVQSRLQNQNPGRQSERSDEIIAKLEKTAEATPNNADRRFADSAVVAITEEALAQIPICH
jgi:hypothetical protein